ncbi:MAG: hypothetical protein HYU36_11205 [Planctomycetes bacterium]|nr:hypothetical protein [Planctomycetota bacterium]
MFKNELIRRMAAGVEKLMETFCPETGRFMTPGYVGPDLGWAVTNQDVVYPLAVLYRTAHPENPYAGREEIRRVVEQAGGVIRRWQDSDGKVEFIKVDGSRWGKIYMPWTMYHWLEAYSWLREEMAAEARRSWEEGLRLAFDGLALELRGQTRVHNIPTWNGMSLVRAGQVFGRADWSAVGVEMIRRAVAAQRPQGYWDEHGGPTTSYNTVYIHALALYHAFTGDESVLDALRRGLDFHLVFTYPDGSPVETVDGRVKYHAGPATNGWPGFSLFPDGRRYIRWLIERDAAAGRTANCTPAMAAAFVHGTEGEEASIPQEREYLDIGFGGLARVRRAGPWFACTSAFTAPRTENRWGMDRQSFVSLYHEACGLIVGGGNSKDQPEWSNFVAGDQFVPTSAVLVPGGVRLDYGGASGSVRLEFSGPRCHISLGRESGSLPLAGQLLLRVTPGRPLVTGGGFEVPAGERPVKVCGREAGGWIQHNGWRLQLPDAARFEHPVSPFNPYAKEGNAPLDQAAGVVKTVLDDAAPRTTFCFEVG